MDAFHEVNDLAATGRAAHFRLVSYDGGRLLIVGSFDLTYYHDVELSFVDVCRINCPTEFHWPQFRDSGVSLGDGGRRFTVRTDEGTFEIVAERAEVAIGKVYHYDRGDELLPGERIAPWVRRRPEGPT